VGDLRRLPFADGTFSAVLDVMTPANYDEFRRVLSPDGMLVKVYPGQDYLREIRAARGMSCASALCASASFSAADKS